MKKSHLFWADWGTFFGSTLVCCGFKDYAEVLTVLKKHHKLSDWHEALRVKPQEFKSNHFSRWHVEGVRDKKSKSYSLLFLIDWQNDVRHYTILGHELVHAIHFCMPDFLDIKEEPEAMAYQHSYLFENIATELNKVFVAKKCYNNKRRKTK